uniref:NADH-ubiquinone oxidoreductase chain 3 n=1 Tax=Ascobulla fragilis TaxID=195875 RepID=B3DFC3_ASCFR|nr:NADH dehydrogenase subunit 3 [Ascobulla fragilis]ACE62810.1 NADH dehydrogenase subunit 3 [Ascobulla fragilis]
MLLISTLFAIVLTIAMVVVYSLTNYNIESGMEEKMTPFECGFDPLSSMRTPFSTRFFLLVVLFLIFDVEVALLFPVLSIFYIKASLFLLSGVFMFLFVLLFGMFHEWNEGALDWVSK